MTKLSELKETFAIALLCAATAIAAQAQTFNTLVDFERTNGYMPGAVVQGLDGNLYGTTSQGGDVACSLAYGCGTVFKITPSGTLTSLYSFCVQAQCPDGYFPSPLVLATDGNFYGTTGGGGEANHGTVFRITPSGTLTTLYSFKRIDGTNPNGLMQGIDGSFYGTTRSGGAHQQGTVFRITPAGKLTSLYSFCAKPKCADGASPISGLIQSAADGSFYGTTYYGGAGLCQRYEMPDGCGTIFKITPAGVLTRVYSFEDTSDDGIYPAAGLVQAVDGTFYGTTTDLDYGGTVFKMTPGGAVTTLYQFCGQGSCNDGDLPNGLVLGTDGSLYGTTEEGGDLSCADSVGCGTVFEITPDGVLTTLHDFELTDGIFTTAALVQATNGSFYGTANFGGDLTCLGEGCGTVYGLHTGLGPFVIFLRGAGKAGQMFGILGQGFTGTTNVSLNGNPANFTVVSDTFIKATVPPGATTGYVTVTTPSGTLTSNVPFRVIQ